VPTALKKSLDLMSILLALGCALLQGFELAHLLDSDARLQIPHRPHATRPPSEDVRAVGEPGFSVVAEPLRDGTPQQLASFTPHAHAFLLG